jgi:hypothetical protein
VHSNDTDRASEKPIVLWGNSAKMRQLHRLVCGSVAARFAFLILGFLVYALPALATGSGPLPLPALGNSLPGGFSAAGPAGTRLPGAVVVPGLGFPANSGSKTP